MTDFVFSTPRKILFGAGRINDIGTLAAELGTSALLVTGSSFMRKSGLLTRVESILLSNKVDVITFDQSPPEPTVDAVEAAIDKFRANKCELVIAIGGGSALDVGKAAAILANAPGTVSEYLEGRALPECSLPFIAVPTTAGSGSEVTPNAVLTDTERRVKASIRSAVMMPDVALIDPELTLTLPPNTTAWSGMDALCQALEAYVSKGSNPITDALALDASVRLLSNLEAAYTDGSNLTLRSEVAMGSLMSGMALANARLGLVHGLAHPLGVRTHLPHGLVCALLLPCVMQFNKPVIGDKYDKIASEVGVDDLVDTIERMNLKMGISEYKTKLTIDKSEWASIIEQAMVSGSTKSNPRTVTEKDIEYLLSLL